jgi:hypothetical protein
MRPLKFELGRVARFELDEGVKCGLGASGERMIGPTGDGCVINYDDALYTSERGGMRCI